MEKQYIIEDNIGTHSKEHLAKVRTILERYLGGLFWFQIPTGEQFDIECDLGTEDNKELDEDGKKYLHSIYIDRITINHEERICKVFTVLEI